MSQSVPGSPSGSESGTRPVASVAGWQAGLGKIRARHEAIWLALAAAELCWAAPVFWALTWASVRHSPLLLWISMLVLMLGFFFFYRALVGAELSLRLQQGLLALSLVLCIVFILRFHALTGSDVRAVDWLLVPLRGAGDVARKVQSGWITIMFLIYLWARAIHLANRSISTEQVGFSFRAGVLLLVIVAVLVKASTALDASGFVMAYFFFALVALALARVEEISQSQNSSPVPFSGFWIGSTVAAVAVLVLLGGVLALFLTGGGLERVARWLMPVLRVVEVIIIAMGTLLLMFLEWLLGLFSVDLTGLAGQLREALSQVALPLEPPPVPALEGESQAWLVLTRVLQVLLPLLIIFLVLLLTWRRMRGRSDDERSGESRESLLSASAVADSLQGMLQDSLQRLGELAGLMKRFGPGARFLTAVSIRRIYSNLVRLATEDGYPRDESETPYEYLATLRQAFPTSDAEVTTITEAYVNARYGQVPDSQEELQRIRDCWERVRSVGHTRSRETGKRSRNLDLEE